MATEVDHLPGSTRVRVGLADAERERVPERRAVVEPDERLELEGASDDVRDLGVLAVRVRIEVADVVHVTRHPVERFAMLSRGLGDRE